MKISISFPPLESEKGIPLLSQNRQFQWFNSPTYIYPMVPAYAATLLKFKGFEVFWDDGIAEKLNYQEWLKRIIQEKPDIIAIETKTPVIKRHWQIINELKKKSLEIDSPVGERNSKFVLMGDHVTTLPEESFQNSQVDFVITGGDYDFLLLSIANKLSGKGELENGIWYRENGEVKNTNKYDLHKHNLDELPMIDRELTKWQLYAYKNGNFKHTPGSYMMSGRDCWWGKCTFCLTNETQVLTVNGVKSIMDIKNGEQVLTHLGNYQKVNKILKRNYKGELIEIKTNCLIPLKLTSNHRVLTLSRKDLTHCLKTGQTGYLCKSNNNFSKQLDCINCRLLKPYLNYKPQYIEAGQIKKGDYLAVPINREIKKMIKMDLRKILNLNPTIIETKKKIEDTIIKKILTLHQQDQSEKNISVILKIDRETVRHYIVLEKEKQLENKLNPIKYKEEEISFEGEKNWIPAEITIEKNVFRLFGYYLAEGCVSKIKNRPNSLVLSFTFNQKEKNYIKDVQKILKNNFKIGVNIHQNNRNHTTQITVGNTLLAKVFKNLFGDNCYNKSLPEFIIKAKIENQVELLRGIFRGDAHYRKRGKRAEYILSTAANILASQLVMLLLRCSAIPNIRKSYLGKKMIVPQNIITLSSIDIINLFGGEKQAKKSQSIYKKGFIVKNYAYLPVMRLKKKYHQGKVYNLSVDKDHSYTANFISVSNCSWTTLFPGKNFRTRSAKKALDEVGHLINLGVKEIMEDSGSLPIGNWLLEFCNGMIERDYNKKVTINCNMRINAIQDSKIWKLMKNAGFRMILFGLESANQKTLDKINKGLKVEEIEPDLKMCKEAGLEPHITAMIGYPWETYEEAKKTVDLAKNLFKKNYVNTLQATIVIPYPGTPLYKYCKENNLLNFEDYDQFDQREQVMKSPLTTEDVKCLTQDLYKSFMTPKFLMKKILSIRNLNDIKFLFRAGLKVFGHLADFGK